MNKILNFLKVLIIPISAFLIFSLVISIFNLFGLHINKITLIIISSIVMIIAGFLIGKKSDKKGFISGGILGFSFIIFLIIVGFLFNIKFSFGRFIYYLILILSSMMGSIIGINKKKTN